MCTVKLTAQLILSTLCRIEVNQAQRKSCNCEEVIAKLDKMQDEDGIEFEWLSESQPSSSLNPDESFLTPSHWAAVLISPLHSHLENNRALCLRAQIPPLLFCLFMFDGLVYWQAVQLFTKCNKWRLKVGGNRCSYWTDDETLLLCAHACSLTPLSFCSWFRKNTFCHMNHVTATCVLLGFQCQFLRLFSITS